MMKEWMAFDVERAFGDIKELAYPRFVGTEGEKKAAEYIKNEFEKAGLEISEEEFSYSRVPLEIMIRAGLLLQSTLILLAAYLFEEYPIASILLAVILISLLCASTQWSKIFGSSMNIGAKHQTKNIIGHLGSEEAKKEIILMAHYDTKSQLMPISLRISIFIVSMLGSIIFSIIMIVFGVGRSVGLLPNIDLFYPGVALFIITMSLLFNTTGNKSPGAIDNASGVAVILEMARVFGEQPPKKLDLKFVATSAEEVGLIGAISFVNAHKDEMSEKTFCINFDGVASKRLLFNTGYGLPVIRTSKLLNTLIKEIAVEKNIDIVRAYLPTGAAADHMPFVEHGFEATGIHSLMLSVHSKRDNLEQVVNDSLENTGIIACELVRRLGDR